MRPGYEAAIAAVMGAAADAVAAENFGAARSAVAALKASDGGRAAIVLGDWPVDAPAPAGPPPEGALWATDLVEMPWRLRGALTAMLTGVVVVRDLSAALDLVAARPQLRAVTTDGDLVGAGWVSGGSDRKPSTLEITSEVEKARDELAAAEKQTNELSAALSGALAEQKARQDSAEQALAALNESDAAISAIYEQLGRLGQDARTADEEWQRLIRQRDELETGRGQTVDELAELETASGQRRAGTVVRRRARGAPGRRSRRLKPREPPKWKHGWRSAQPRSGRMPFAGGRIRCAARQPRNGKPGCGPSARGRPASMPRRSRRRWPSPAAALRSA